MTSAPTCSTVTRKLRRAGPVRGTRGRDRAELLEREFTAHEFRGEAQEAHPDRRWYAGPSIRSALAALAGPVGARPSAFPLRGREVRGRPYSLKGGDAY